MLRMATLQRNLKRMKSPSSHKLTPASLYTHMMVACNTSTEGKLCQVHRDGVPRLHRVRKDSVQHFADALGRD